MIYSGTPSFLPHPPTLPVTEVKTRYSEIFIDRFNFREWDGQTRKQATEYFPARYDPDTVERVVEKVSFKTWACRREKGYLKDI